MIGCELKGGLGNQFFRYAYARHLQIERGMSDKLMICLHADYHGQISDIRDFCISEYDEIEASNIVLKFGYWWQVGILCILKFFHPVLSRLVNYKSLVKWEYRTLGRCGIIASYTPDSEKLTHPSKNLKRVFTRGNFENITFFNDIIDSLLEEFTPKYPPLKANHNLYKIINNTNSVCLAVRRGDFINEENKKDFYVCDMNYFQRAIEYMTQHVESPVFIIFSNDIDWVKNNLKIDGEAYYESGNDPVWETYRLMYNCKHFIISNSTLHWWAQEKGRYKGKIVVSPNRWYNMPGWEQHLLKDTFVKIPTGVANPYQKNCH